MNHRRTKTAVPSRKGQWIAALLLIMLTGCKPSPLKELGTIEPFQLKDTSGATVEWESLRGEPVLVFFGYTYCPDYCPMTLAKIEKAQKKAGRKDWPRLVFITVDPERDTPEAIDRYLDPRPFPTLGLTGSIKELRNAGKKFGVTFYPEPDNPELFQHSPTLFVIDEGGDIRYLFKFSQSSDELIEVVNALL